MNPKHRLINSVIVGSLLMHAQVRSQTREVVVEFSNDFKRAGEVLSVGDSSIAFKWNVRPEWNNIAAVDGIKAMVFTKTEPGNPSFLEIAGGAVAGGLVGGALGLVLGEALDPPHVESSASSSWFSRGLFPQIRPGPAIGFLFGATAGGYIGKSMVEHSVVREIRFDPKIPAQRDSLRVFLQSP